MAVQIGEASVVLSNWGASKVSEIIKDKMVLAGWTVYDSGGNGTDSRPWPPTATGAYWWVLKHATEEFYVFLRDAYQTTFNYPGFDAVCVEFAIGNGWDAATNNWKAAPFLHLGGDGYYRLVDFYSGSAIGGHTCWIEYCIDTDFIGFYVFMDQSTIYWKRNFLVITKMVSWEGQLYSVTPWIYFQPSTLAWLGWQYTLDGNQFIIYNDSLCYVNADSTWYIDEIKVQQNSVTTTTVPPFTGTKIIGKLPTDYFILASIYDSNSSCGSDLQTITVTATGFKYLIARLHQQNYHSGTTAYRYYSTTFGSSYRSWGLRTNL